MRRMVGVAASAGGLQALCRIVAALPSSCTASFFVVIHIGEHRSHLPTILNAVGVLPASHARNGTLIESRHIYVAPPDHHMLVGAGQIWLNQGPKVHFTRPAADPLLQSLAETYGENAVGVVLSGMGDDGAAGLRTITEHGGLAIVEDPAESPYPAMPRAALAAVKRALCLSLQGIAEHLAALCLTPDPNVGW
jgi:two-component system, chemotaxis family, protein-glutamate methylesterase/glutaminase